MPEPVPATPLYYRLTVRKRARSRETEERIVCVADQSELDREIARFGGRYLGCAPARLHTCSACGRKAPWDDKWFWFGSYKELDDRKPLIKICSDACRVEAKRKGLIPKNAPNEVVADA